jgi:hypothetical protein
MNSNGKPDPLTRYVGALLQVSGQLRRVIDHMARHESPHAEEPPNEVLARLLREILDPEFDEREPELTAAARALADTSETIERELYLVEP